MLNVLQSLRTGATQLVEVPVPRVSSNSMLVASRASLISPGTERMLVEFGRASLVEKAKSQPDKVRQVMAKVATDGLGPTLEAVLAKLDTPIALGYCQAGTVLEIGREVVGFCPGDRVVTNGPHAEYVRVTPTLAAKIPDGVSFEAAAFTPLAAIGLEGLRLANPTLGEFAVVYGLGPIGLLSVQLAIAAGCNVIAIDQSAARCSLAEQFGARVICAGSDTNVASAVEDMTGGMGADLVLLTLSTDSHDPVKNAANMSRKRGRVILVGVTGLNLSRDDFYKKELSLQISCSYGPGRYDPSHEERGIDYPLPYVRWTEGRNFAAVLRLMADGRVDPSPLISHRFAIKDAASAYDLIASGAASLGVLLTYDSNESSSAPQRTVTLRSHVATAHAGRVGFIGAGSFASRVLIPAFKQAGAELEIVASGAGVSAAVAAKQHGFNQLTSDVDTILRAPEVDTVVVVTRHDSHSDFVLKSLQAGKHVFVEKPLALSTDELERVAQAAINTDRLLCVGFNRRFAPHVRATKAAAQGRISPAVISITINAGSVPRDHWTQTGDSGGGRILGEGCHFIDLARFLVGAPIRQLQVFSARTSGGQVVDDIALLQLSFADGSLATIQYFSNGNKNFPKERVEMFYDGKGVRLDNFRTVVSWGIPALTSRWPRRQDKGHRHLVSAFISAVRSGGVAPIPLDELIEVSRVAIAAGRLASQGGGSASFLADSSSALEP